MTSTSVKLTKEIKDNITTDIIEHKYGPSFKALSEEEYAFALEMYNHHYKNDLDRMNALPKGWLRQTGGVSFTTTNHGRHSFDFSDSKKRKLLPYLDKDRNDYGSGFGIQLNQNSYPDFLKRAEGLIEKRELLKTARKEAQQKIKAALSKFNTSKQLIEGWPEISQFVEDNLPIPYKSNLPSVLLSQLNSELGLPPETKAA